MGKDLVFVYGTLRRGQGNHHRLAGARCLGLARTAPGLFLMEFTGVPVVTHRDRSVWGRGAARGWPAIVGEVYEVGPGQLAALDRLEGHPRWYERRRHAVRLQGGRVVRAWVYEAGAGWCRPGALAGSHVVPGGDWVRMGEDLGVDPEGEPREEEGWDAADAELAAEEAREEQARARPPTPAVRT